MQLKYNGTEPMIYCTGRTLHVVPGDVIEADEAEALRLIGTGQFARHSPPAAEQRGRKKDQTEGE